MGLGFVWFMVWVDGIRYSGRKQPRFSTPEI
jgi:hypothetical protein